MIGAPSPNTDPPPRRYGNGLAQATGGALPIPPWNGFADDLGFPDLKVAA